MKIKLIFYLCAVVFVANSVSARGEQQKRRRPIVDSSAQDSDGNYVDQIALDSVNYASPSQTVVASPQENYPANFYTGKKLKKPTLSSEQKVQYVTQEIYSAPPKVTKENYPPPSGLEYTYINRTEAKKSSTTSRQKQKVKDDYADYSYYFPESKRINAKTPAKASTSPNVDKFYQSQSPSSSLEPVVRKEVSKNGEELTYHYYYPEESTHDDQKLSVPSFPSSTTFSPSTTRSPSPSSSFNYSSKKKTNHEQHTSTDTYQYPPVLQRPNEYDLIGSEAPHETFYSTYESPKTIKSHSTITPSTVTPIKILKPTKKNLHYLPSSTLSPSTTARPKIRRPSTDTPFTEIKKFSLPPSVTSTIAPHYSTTTRAPELYAYSTTSPVSSTLLSNDFYIKPSTQVTPTISSSSNGDLNSDSSSERTVVIKPKVQYTHTENYEQQQQQQQPMVKETIVYKYVDPQEYYGGSGSFESNKTTHENEMYYTPTSDSETAKTPEYYKELNQSVQADMDFYNDFHKNYNYQYFTEQDATNKMSHGEDKIDGHTAEDNEEEIIDDKQRASKKNMVFAISPEPRYAQTSVIPVNLQDHEVPPPMTDADSENDLASEASKNQQYFVLYSVDDDNRDSRDGRENRKERKSKKKVRPTDADIIFHHQQQQQQQQHHLQQQQQQDERDRDYDDEFQQFDTEFDSEFDSDVINSDNVRIVDPSVRGGRPIEFTKDDYLRHIKQAVVQYMKNIQVTKEPNLASSTPKAKITKYQENQQDSLLRPTKASLPSALVSSTALYKNTLSPQQYKPLTSLKLPKNVYTADRLKEAIEDIQESPQIDLTVKKSKVKPFDLSAIDVGQTYQHVTHFDHSAALKNVEEFDQSNVMTGTGGGNKQKLHFSQQTYHDINNLGHNQKHKLSDDNDNDNANANLFKGYVLPSKYQAKLVSQQNVQPSQNTFSAMNYDASKLPRIVSHHSNNGDDDEDENKVDETIDAPIQIINGIPVANPYNIDLNTLKYMLGGIAQAEVNDQIRDLDESSSQKVTNSWKGLSSSFTSSNPIYQVYGQQQHHNNKNENSSQKQKKNNLNNGSNSNNNKPAKFPLVGTLVNFNKMKNSGNKQRNVKNTLNIQDYSNWNHANKKQRTELQPTQTQNVFVVRPMIRNKHARDDRKSLPPPRLREPAREMRPPPIKQKPIYLARLN